MKASGMIKKNKGVILIVLILVLSLTSNIALLWKYINDSNHVLNLAKNYMDNFPQDIQPVGLTELDKTDIAFVDYKDLYFLNTESHQLSRPVVTFEKTFKNKQVLQSPTNFQPTAVFYDQQNQLLYIANFNLHDVLIAKINAARNQVMIEEDITDPDMVSPENVVVDNKDGLIVIADYDKSGIFVFNMQGALEWKRLGLSMAHGVDAYNGNIYVSLFGGTKLIEYDDKGNLKREVKDVGFGLGQYLYPTNIETIPDSLKGYFKNGDLMILDARTGSLTVTDANLKPLMKFGENGPQEDEYNLPYGLLVANNEIFIGDTYKRRIVIFNPATEQNDYVTFEQQDNIGKMPNYGVGPDAYVADQLVPQQLKDFLIKNFPITSQVEVKPAFQTLALYLDGDRYFDILLPFQSGSFGQDNRPTFGFGFSWAYATKSDNTSYVLIGSNDRNQIVVLDLNSGFYDIVTIPEELVVWGPSKNDSEFGFVANYAISSFRKQSGDKFAENLEKYRDSRLAAYVETICDNPADYRELINENIYTSVGKQLFTKWQNGEDIHLDVTQYFKSGEPIALDELYILKLMSDTPLKRLESLISYKG